jgi:hypothetical protein
MENLPAALTRHVRFYGALAAGVAAWLAARRFGQDGAALAGGDFFYLVFLMLCVPLLGQTPAALKQRARREDEGIVVVVLVTLATMGFFLVAVFAALNRKHGGVETPALALAAIGVPLGWCVLHTIMAFHYAALHYFDDPGEGIREGSEISRRRRSGRMGFSLFLFCGGHDGTGFGCGGNHDGDAPGGDAAWHGVVLLQHCLHRLGGECRRGHGKLITDPVAAGAEHPPPQARSASKEEVVSASEGDLLGDERKLKPEGVTL